MLTSIICNKFNFINQKRLTDKNLGKTYMLVPVMEAVDYKISRLQRDKLEFYSHKGSFFQEKKGFLQTRLESTVELKMW